MKDVFRYNLMSPVKPVSNRTQKSILWLVSRSTTSSDCFPFRRMIDIDIYVQKDDCCNCPESEWWYWEIFTDFTCFRYFSSSFLVSWVIFSRYDLCSNEKIFRRVGALSDSAICLIIFMYSYIPCFLSFVEYIWPLR